MWKVPPITIEEIEARSRDPELWKQKRDRARKTIREPVFGLKPEDWRTLRETVISNRQLIYNADSVETAVQRVKRDARICSADWIRDEHIRVAMLLIG